jgi:HK97 family phage prohead protease
MSEIEKRSSLATIEKKDNYIIEGYPILWEPYKFYEEDGVQIYEKIERSALENCDFSDCALKKEHVGDVYARVKNGSLTYKIDSKGVFMRADLSATAKTRELYEEIKAGLYSELSWAFVVEEQTFDKKTRTQIVKKVKKCYDFSVVHVGANSNTSVYARSVNLTGEVKKTLVEIQQRKSLEANYLRTLKEVQDALTNH